MYSILPGVISLVFIWYGFYALATRGLNRVTGTFFLLCLTTFFWQGTWALLFQTEHAHTAGVLAKIGYFFILFLPTSFYHFHVEITGRYNDRTWVYISYVLSSVLVVTLLFTELFIPGVYHYSWGYYPRAGVLHPVHVAQTAVVVMRTLYITYRAQEVSFGDAQTRLRLCMIGTLIFSFAAIDYLCIYGREFYPPGIIFIALGLGFITIAIVKYSLFNPVMPAGMAGSLAHELRTPLATIHNQAAGIARNLPTLLDAYRVAVQNKWVKPSLGARQIDMLSQASQRITDELYKSNVIIDMMLASRAIERPDRLVFERCLIGTCVKEAVERYPYEPGDEARVRTEICANFEFIGSDTLMVFLLFNLMKNSLFAVKARGNGYILISTEIKDGEHILRFTDTGTGIPAKDLSRIFDPYFSTKNKYGGTGMGLDFCRKVMKAFNGTITYESVEGEYTTAILTFPPHRASNRRRAEP